MNSSTQHVVHLGPQKSATTWLYECFKEHPELACNESSDSIHYYSMQFHRGEEWYVAQFENKPAVSARVDMSTEYIRCPLTPTRIAHDAPDSLLIMCMRHPIERAFSHYWHEKKKRRFDFRFEEVLDNYDLFANWVEPGLYGMHLERWLAEFSRDQLLVQEFSKLQENPASFLEEALQFIGVDSAFKPHALTRKVNVARPERSIREKRWRNRITEVLRHMGVMEQVKKTKLVRRQREKKFKTGRQEYLSQTDPKILKELEQVIEPDIIKLEQLLGVDLSHWRRNGNYA